MSNSDYSRLLTKMAELKSLTAEYTTLTNTYQPALSSSIKGKYMQKDNKNAISNTATPLVTRPGEDFGQYWKYVGKIKPGPNPSIDKNSLQCWNLAANDLRLFKKVVYTGDSEYGSNPGQPEWNNRCYGLIYDASDNASFDTNSTGYSVMVGNTGNNIYTKLGITSNTDTANISGASKVQDIQQRVNSLVKEIVELSESGIDSELNALVSAANDTNEQIKIINNYMNDGASSVNRDYDLIEKRKNMNDVYTEVNEQRTLFARRYQFIFYIVIALSIIIGYASYTSELSMIEQFNSIKNLVGVGWWTSWWAITIVIIVLILSSFGWDMKGNIMMVIRYISDPEFWTGQMWWVGVTFILLIIIFFYGTFKSFFVEFDAGMKEIQDKLNDYS
jgi:hypothetical protein